jgi:hypothetical protein
MFDAEQAIEILYGRDKYKENEDQRDIADLISRQQAVCDTARKVIEYDLLPNDYADVCCHCKNKKQDCAECRKYCPSFALKDALNRLEGES